VELVPQPGGSMKAGRALGLATALAWGVAVLACEPEEPAWVDPVEAAHAQADRARAPAEVASAQAALEQAYAQVPQSSDPREVWVRQDLCARIGELWLARGEPARGLEWVEKGLELSHAITVARANLLGLKGRALEALGQKEQAA